MPPAQNVIGLVPVLLAALAFGGVVAPGALAAGEPTANTCPVKGGSYPITVPKAGTQADSGGDPAAEAAVHCALGYHEKQEYPLSLIGVCLLFTAGALILVKRRSVHDGVGSAA